LDSCENAEAADVKSEALAEGCVTSVIAKARDRNNADLLSIKLHPADSDKNI
jgi:hypothetical protein